MAKITWKNRAHSKDSTTAESTGGKRDTAIFDAWRSGGGELTIDEIAENAADLCDLEVTDIHVSAYVRGMKKVQPALYKAMPAIVKPEGAGRGRQAAAASAESDLLALLDEGDGDDV